MTAGHTHTTHKQTESRKTSVCVCELRAGGNGFFKKGGGSRCTRVGVFKRKKEKETALLWCNIIDDDVDEEELFFGFFCVVFATSMMDGWPHWSDSHSTSARAIKRPLIGSCAQSLPRKIVQVTNLWFVKRKRRNGPNLAAISVSTVTVRAGPENSRVFKRFDLHLSNCAERNYSILPRAEWVTSKWCGV